MKFSVALQRKQVIGKLFFEDIYIFPIISSGNEIEESQISFFLLNGNKGSFITNLLSKNWVLNITG